MNYLFNQITYPSFFAHRWVRKLWRRFACPRRWHLLDECSTIDDHYLICDACELEVEIRRIKSPQDSRPAAPEGEKDA